MQYLMFILAAALWLLLPGESFAQQDHSDHEHVFTVGGDLQPGDKGFDHDAMHPYYQMIFDSGRCYCHTGECRPTRWRHSETSPTGIQMILNREWVDIPAHAIVQRDSVPPELWAHPAHICGFPNGSGGNTIECAIVILGL